MPNYMRHVVAGFLVEFLNLDWRLGERWFDYTLVDADTAINAYMWQNGGHSGFDQWNFRFKAAAGDSYTREDPWWRGLEPICLRFCTDGSVRSVKDAMPFWGPAGSVGGRWQLEPGAFAWRSLPPDSRPADRPATSRETHLSGFRRRRCVVRWVPRSAVRQS